MDIIFYSYSPVTTKRRENEKKINIPTSSKLVLTKMSQHFRVIFFVLFFHKIFYEQEKLEKGDWFWSLSISVERYFFFYIFLKSQDTNERHFGVKPGRVGWLMWMKEMSFKYRKRLECFNDNLAAAALTVAAVSAKVWLVI